MNPIESRADLIHALRIAAEIEHGISCQYLFAAFALRDPRVLDQDEDGLPRGGTAHTDLTPDQAALIQGWKRQLLMIARQEMAHLGLVNNLLTAVGGTPHFRRPNFPQAEGMVWPDTPLDLRALDSSWLDQFMEFESPPKREKGVPARLMVNPPQHFPSLYGHYSRIRDALESGDWIVEKGGRQVGNQEVFGEPGVTRAYDFAVHVVNTRDSALAALSQIMLEGEGSPEEPADQISHFGLLSRMKQDLAQHPNLRPSRDVGPNPITYTDFRFASGKDTTLIDHPIAKPTAELFNSAYQTLLNILERFYLRAGETERELAALQAAAFFPLMVMVIRPLGEVLATMPASASDPDGKRAGAPFEMLRSTETAVEKGAAWKMIVEQLEALHTACSAIAKELSSIGEGERPPWASSAGRRLTFLSENLWKIADSFRRNVT